MANERGEFHEVDVLWLANDAKLCGDLGGLSVDHVELALALLDEVLRTVGLDTVDGLGDDAAEDLLNRLSLRIQNVADAVQELLNDRTDGHGCILHHLILTVRLLNLPIRWLSLAIRRLILLHV